MTRRTKDRGNWVIPVTAGVLAAYAIAAVIVPLAIGYDPQRVDVIDRLLAPGSRLSGGGISVFGTDQSGRDILGEVTQGARVSLLVGVLTIVLGGGVGTALGIAAGFLRGATDTAVMRLADMQLAFPSILLAVFIAAVLGPSVPNVVITLGITAWPLFARVARAQTIAVRDREFVDASRTLGARAWHIVRHAVVPAVMGPVLVVATAQFGLVIVAEASLSFLGLGVPAGVPSWGRTISAGRDYLDTAWWICTIPGIALAVLVVAAGTLGDALRERFNPYRTRR
jgi:peptide/nickel transport system permease protein